ncbi:ATP-binding protein [Streptomyces sp. NPDC057654]|uniref:ATP-binding protein n=1 Tax=Streptomyces sp. NPDC057654 TaxID=3346196 RepID=UPI0036BD8ACA
MTVLEETALTAVPRRQENPLPYARSLTLPDRESWPLSPGSWGLSLATVADPELVSMYRATCALMLAHWDLKAITDDVLSVVSELVTNAMIHGDGVSLDVAYAEDGTLLIVVTDGSPNRPERLDPASDDEHGRGLMLVEALSVKWGISADGKSTFAILNVPGGGLR